MTKHPVKQADYFIGTFGLLRQQAVSNTSLALRGVRRNNGGSAEDAPQGRRLAFVKAIASA